MTSLFSPIRFVALGIALACLPNIKAQTTEETAPASSRSSLERATFALINEYRKSSDLPVLAWSDEIAKTARIHSKDMARGDVDFGHDGFSDRMAHLRHELPGLTGCGENVLMTSDPSEVAHSAVRLWLNSPPHRKNIRGDYNYSGIGVWENAQGIIYFTQIFVRLQPVIPEAVPAEPVGPVDFPPARSPAQTQP
jgi:uncharacterized protein YkwD